MKFNYSNIRARSIGCALTVFMLGAVATNSTSELALTSNEIESSQSSQNNQSLTNNCESTKSSLSSIEHPNYNYIEETEEEPLETYLMYVNGSSVRYRSVPVIHDSTVIGTLDSGDEVDVVSVTGEWCKCIIDDEIVYIYADLLTEECISKDIIEANSDSVSNQVVTLIYNSETPLSATLGRVNGPSGEETFYNLNMKGCVNRLHDLGYEGEYWIREDGVKMFGDYIMVAANFDIRPIGTVIETSLGTGIVCDCGEFVTENPTQIDVAVTW